MPSLLSRGIAITSQAEMDSLTHLPLVAPKAVSTALLPDSRLLEVSSIQHYCKATTVLFGRNHECTTQGGILAEVLEPSLEILIL